MSDSSVVDQIKEISFGKTEVIDDDNVAEKISPECNEGAEIDVSEYASARQSINVDDFTETDEGLIKDEAEESLRGNWSHHIEFILSCIGYAVGLGNVWRFPYQCYRNGGGCFLVVYWILSCCVGFPLVYFEQSIGQFTSQGPMHCWGFAPIIRGIGYSMVALSALACIYYNIIISWSLFMLFASFQAVLPWTYCDFSLWADYRCEMKFTPCDNNATSLYDEVRATDGLCYNATFLADRWYVDPSARFFNFTTCPNSTASSTSDAYFNSYYGFNCINVYDHNTANTFRNSSTVIGFWDENLAVEHDVSPKLSSDEYFHHYVLRLYEGHSTENIGYPSWGLALCLLLAWLIVFACLVNGIQSSGKVVYFTAVFPYLILFILIGRGVSLPGAIDGLMFYLTPDFEKIKQPSVWFAAANQLFFSLSCSWGGMIALSSYNKFENNVLRDAIITVFADSFTSFIAGFAVFSIIGYGAQLLNKPVDKVAAAGTGLAFVMYPKIMMELPGSVAWSIAFFFMLLLLGLDSEFNTMETVLTAFLDQMPFFRKTLLRKSLFLGCFCFAFYLLGLPMICNGGSVLSVIVDEYSSGWGALIIGIIETLSISWLYGFSRYHEDLKLMMGTTWSEFGRYYIATFWGVVSPGIVTFILIYSWVTYEPIAETLTDEIIGWCCVVFVLIWPPAIAIYEIYTAKGSILNRVREKCRPTREWGPYFVKHRKLVKHLGDSFEIDPRHIMKPSEKPLPANSEISVDLATSDMERVNPVFELDETSLNAKDIEN